jgi:hypothetical protein
MSERYPGARISATPPVPAGPYQNGTASGVWSLDQQLQYQKQGIWPTAGLTPNYIEDVFSTYLYNGTSASRTVNNNIAVVSGVAPTGVSGGSAQLIGTSAYMTTTLNSSGASLTGNMTIEGWMNVTPVSNAGVFSFSAAGGVGDRVFMQLYNNNIYMGWGNVIQNVSNAFTGHNSSSGYLANSWHHFALVRNSSAIKLYIDGNDMGVSGTVSSNPTGYDLYIGDVAAGAIPFSGYISNFRITKSAVYTAPFIPPTTALTAIANVGLLTLQGATPFVDNSGNGFTITQVNSPVASSTGPYPITSITGYGGLTWIKMRSAGYYPRLYDSSRGANAYLNTVTTDAQGTETNGLIFTPTGFATGNSTYINDGSNTFASWTFRKQPKFFDVVTWTGNGASNRLITHALNAVPAVIMIKATSTTGSWYVNIRSSGLNGDTTDFANAGLGLESSSAKDSSFLGTSQATAWTSTQFTLYATGARTNVNGVTYVAYIFAHNAGGFGLTGTDNVISCGVFNENNTSNVPVTLGYEPQYVMFKCVDTDSAWYITDIMRGIPTPSSSGVTGNYISTVLQAQSTNPEGLANAISITPTGFVWYADGRLTNTAKWIYIAIRRGPMKTPTLGTSVFDDVIFNGGSSSITNSLSFTPDTSILEYRSSWNYPIFTSRLTGKGKLIINQTDAENTANTDWVVTDFDNTNAIKYNDYTGGNLSSRSGSWISWNFKRAPGFFDVVCYTGTGGGANAYLDVSHNLGVTPEMIIVKRRDTADTAPYSWPVYQQAYTSAGVGATWLVSNIAKTTDYVWRRGASGQKIDASTFSLNGNYLMSNQSGGTYVAYLFATCPGVSKVGSYTGTGATQTISCGFTGGARFVLVKRTDTTGDWYVWDTARGMVSGTDPSLLLNTTAAEVNANSIYTATGGFQIVSTAAGINASGGTYIYLAIA